jgi:hypothetical protein
MSPNEALLEKWRGKLSDGSYDDCRRADELQADSFCVVFDMCWGGPDVCDPRLLAPEYFASPGDFVAFVRTIELPRCLGLLIGLERDASWIKPVETYLEVLGTESRALARAVVTACERALAQPVVFASDADEVIGAFNSLFSEHDDAAFIAFGDLTTVFASRRITSCFDAWSEDAEGLLGDDEPEMVVKRLVDAGELNPDDPSHLALARELLAEFPLS